MLAPFTTVGRTVYFLSDLQWQEYCTCSMAISTLDGDILTALIEHIFKITPVPKVTELKLKPEAQQPILFQHQLPCSSCHPVYLLFHLDGLEGTNPTVNEDTSRCEISP